MQNIFKIFIIAAFSVMLYSLYENFNGNDELSELASFYAAKENVEAVQSANLVTAVVVTYRGLDTLGEVTILFLTAAIIGFFLKAKNTNEEPRIKRETSEILETASKLLVPLMMLFGVYVFMNGHLSPGGGFQGGAIIASAIILMLLAQPNMQFNHKLFTFVESISGLAFIFIGILGILLAGGFLDNRIVSMGTFGELVSAGAIPIIYSFVGLKVGAELSNLIGNFQEAQTECKTVND